MQIYIYIYIYSRLLHTCIRKLHTMMFYVLMKFYISGLLKATIFSGEYDWT